MKNTKNTQNKMTTEEFIEVPAGFFAAALKGEPINVIMARLAAEVQAWHNIEDHEHDFSITVSYKNGSYFCSWES